MSNDFVLTPGGFKPSANVHHVPRGHHLRMNGDTFEIHHPTEGLVARVGKIKRHVSEAPLMPTNVTGKRPKGPLSNLLEAVIPDDDSLNGWMSFASWTNKTGSPISLLASTWTVPEEPNHRGTQTVFLFNGIQNSTMIYQPVLQWGTSAAGGGQQWSVACWYADSPTGHSFYSDLVRVAPGDQLTGVMSLVDRNGASFSYSAEFVGIQETQLPIHNVDELNWANETLEAYGINGRDDLPASAETIISAIELQTVAGGAAIVWLPDDAQPASGTQITPVVNSGTNGSLEITYAKAGG